MLFQYAAIHHHVEPSFPGARGGGFMDYIFLHPYRARARLNRRFHHFRNLLRTPENIHNINSNVFWYCAEVRIRLLAKHFCFVGVDGDNSVARALHVSRDAEAGPGALR